VVAVAGAAGFGITDYVRDHRHDRDTVSGAAIPDQVGGASARPAAPAANPGTPATPEHITLALRQVATDPDLGPRLRAMILDAATGSVLYDRGGTAPAAPASTAKILTAVAVLATHRPTDRITTRVVRGTSAGTAVLVGGGDPTLTAATGATAPAYAGAARISDLAAQLRKRNLPIIRIVVDGSRFSGPTVSPAWAPEDVPSDYASAITAVMADGGRADPGDTVRSASPDLAAGAALASDLDVPDAQIVRGRAPAHATVLATVRSATYATLLEEMLQASDNVLAEALGRQVAIAMHQPASFAGAARAVRQVLAKLGVDPGTGMLDSSGLSARDRISVVTLTRVLRLVIADRDHSLRTVLSDLPVSAWSGTLATRFVGTNRAAGGLVRAKTGTLTGVSSLAGVVHTADGRLLVFALIADQVPPGYATYAEAAEDAIVSRLAACGCS
jgi:D-alanyl-D-alanine carboxypeptidase/D-alanyl-D-alanine-endopeptidase (penicillin-binding protein 4)